MQLLSIVVLSLSGLLVAGDYYWKDYYGYIPNDAFQAGVDGGGNPTYVGQSYFSGKNHLLPTIITKGEKSAYLIVGKERWAVDHATKILCSSNNSLFQWIPTDSKKVRYLTSCKQVEGGWSPGVIITVGRANHQGRTLTGRVYDNDVHNYHGLYIHDGNNVNLIVKEFEILVYNCSNPWVEPVV